MILKSITATLRLPSINWKLLIVIITSIVITITFLYGRPFILFNGGDPMTYFRKAWWLIGRTDIGGDVPSRGIGYPLILLLTGAASYDFWWFLIGCQILMAVMSPILIYGIILPYSKNAALIGSLLFMLFGISHENMMWVMTEQSFLFFELLSFFIISKYFSNQTQTHLRKKITDIWNDKNSELFGSPIGIYSAYSISIVLAFTSSIKPAASIFYWIFIVATLLTRRKCWKSLIAPSALYISFMLLIGVHSYIKSPVRFPSIVTVEAPQRNFGDAYYGDSLIESNESRIKPSNGPASKRLFFLVNNYVAKIREIKAWNGRNEYANKELYEKFNDDDLTIEIFSKPNPIYYQIVLQAVYTDGIGGNKLLLEVASENGYGKISGFFKYLKNNPQLPFIGLRNSYVGYHFFSKYYRYRDFRYFHEVGPRDVLIPSFNSTNLNLLQAENGPISKKLFDSLSFYIDIFPYYADPSGEFIKYFGDAHAFKKYVIENNVTTKFAGGIMGNIYGWIVSLHGEEKAGKLFLGAALESTKKNALTWNLLMGDYFTALAYSGFGYFSVPNLLLDPNATFQSIKKIDNDYNVQNVATRVNSGLPEGLGKDLSPVKEKSVIQKNISAMESVCYQIFRFLKPFFFVGLLIFIMPLIIERKTRGIAIFLIVCFFASAAAFNIAMIMPAGDPRHEDVYAFIPLLIIMIGLSTSINSIKTSFTK